MENSEKIIHDVQHGICTITLNNTKIHNAFDNKIIIQLTKILNKINSNNKIRCVILRANGKHFSAGADINWMKQMMQATESENEKDALQLAHLLQTLNTLSKPTIALVHGLALGGAVGLVACCDIAIANSDSMFCFSEVKLGLIPATIAPYVIRSIGYSATRSLFITAKRFSAETAKQIGLIQQIVSDENLDEVGINLAKQLKHNAPNAMTAAKELVNELAEIDPKITHDTAKLLAKIRISDECQEGMQAFLNKRKPNWITEDDHV